MTTSLTSLPDNSAEIGHMRRIAIDPSKTNVVRAAAGLMADLAEAHDNGLMVLDEFDNALLLFHLLTGRELFKHEDNRRAAPADEGELRRDAAVE